MPAHRLFTTAFAAVYPLYVQKARRKGRTKEEVDQVVCWLTGYDPAGLRNQIEGRIDFQTFFARAPAMNPDAALIKGLICGVRVEDVEDPLMQRIRQLDKLVDELARGKAMDKILRSNAGPSPAGTKRFAKATPPADAGTPAAELIDRRIAELADWRGDLLARLRALIKNADPAITEDWKWNTPVWSRGGIVCTGETYKRVVKLTFPKGASLPDPSKLFNSSLDGKVRRAIDFAEGATFDSTALATLVRAAAGRNPG